MKKVSLTLLAVLLIAVIAFSQSQTERDRQRASGNQKKLADQLQKKLDYLRVNGAKPQPDQKPTVLLEQEVNAYFADGRIKLPNGVERVEFQGTPGHIAGTSRVDFDKLTEGKRSSNPLYAIFSGKHDVQVLADADGSGGQGHVHVKRVTIDGTQVPRMAIEFFVDHYLKNRYPNVGLDSTFNLPSRIDMALVGTQRLTLTQK